MYCKKCGKEIAEHSLFCSFCGSDLASGTILNDQFSFISKYRTFLYLFFVWFLLNTLWLMILQHYDTRMYQISTFLAPLLYYSFRMGIKHVLSFEKMRKYKMQIRVLSLIIGAFPVFFIIMPMVYFVRETFDLRIHTAETCLYTLTILLVEFFYRDLFILENNSSISIKDVGDE